MNRPTLVASALLTLAVAGCSSGSHRAATVTAKPQQAQVTASAPAASTTHLASAGSQPARSHHGQEPTDTELAAVLLTVQDMPTGWAVSPPSPSPSGSDDTTFVGDPKCRAVYKELEEHTASDHVGHASTEFSKGSFGPFIEEDLSSFVSADTVKDEMKALRSA